MGVDKVILRSILTTLAAVAVLFASMIVALVCVFPSTAMELTYDLGMDSASVHFARRSYKESGEIYYIAYATEVAIGDNDYAKIEACGEKFIADGEFAAYCEEKNKALPEGASGTYEQYVYGQVCTAKYALDKKDEAVSRAFELIGTSFPQNNAAVAVLVAALKAQDASVVAQIKGKMEELQGGISETDRAYFEQILALTNG